MKATARMSLRELASEHEHLVKVLRKPNKRKLSNEAKKQAKELKEYKSKI